MSLLSAPPSGSANGDYVVLLHGIMRTDRSMRKLEKEFEKAGFRVLNIDYPSRKFDIETLTGVIHQKITAECTDADAKIHFVGHSMGGLLARAYIEKYRPGNLGRVVMIGTPNGGSEVADKLGNLRLFRSFYGPAGQQLKTAHPRPAPQTTYEVGVIAGNRTIDPVSSLMLPGENDGKVTVASTHFPGEKDHIVLPVTHSFMQGNSRVVRQAVHFIKNGNFLKNG